MVWVRVHILWPVGSGPHSPFRSATVRATRSSVVLPAVWHGVLRGNLGLQSGISAIIMRAKTFIVTLASILRHFALPVTDHIVFLTKSASTLNYTVSQFVGLSLRKSCYDRLLPSIVDVMKLSWESFFLKKKFVHSQILFFYSCQANIVSSLYYYYS